jgi:hypothetical protein
VRRAPPGRRPHRIETRRLLTAADLRLHSVQLAIRVVAAAMIDRLVHHAEILALKGDSLRRVSGTPVHVPAPNRSNMRKRAYPRRKSENRCALLVRNWNSAGWSSPAFPDT